MTLVEFLRVRLDEDEQAAKRVPQPYRLYVSSEGRLSEPLEDEHGGYAQWADGSDRMPNHITNWELAYEPARVLREVEAKRRLIADFEVYDASARYPDSEGGIAIGLGTAVELAALAYADHPDYDEAWRP